MASVIDVHSHWRSQPVDGGRLHFDRTTGSNLLERGPHTRLLRRQAPRVLQVGLLTPCNLSCSFCYRDPRAPSRLTAGFLEDLLVKAADWGVLEVAFGGGEPLLFKGLPGLVQGLRARTSLGINFTTNGMLLSDPVIDALQENVGEIRVSVYEENGYRRTLRRLAARGIRAGANLLVTPENVGKVSLFVRDLLSVGAQNVLLLGYKGDDPKLHLDERDRAELRSQLAHVEGLPVRLDICWYPLLRDLPHLFPRADCGAGDEFLVITPDRAVQTCSFSRLRTPFETIDDLRSIWERMRQSRSHAGVSGCTRELFSPAEAVPPPSSSQGVELHRWEAFSSNNSGDWTIVGRFERAEDAEQVAASLRELARAHETFLASSAGQSFVEENDWIGRIPTPPLRHFGEAHGFAWDQEEDGLVWEAEGFGAPVLTAGAVGSTVVVYHPYCGGLPERPFREFFARTGASAFGSWDYGAPRIRIRAEGGSDLAKMRLRDHVEHVRKNPEDEGAPPWGATPTDPRVADDEDRDANLASREPVELTEEAAELVLSGVFRNSFAGPLAVMAWLKEEGFRAIRAEVQTATLDPISPPPEGLVKARTGLFGDTRPLSERLRTATPESLIELVLATASLEGPLLEAATQIPVDERIRLGRERFERLQASGVEGWSAAMELAGTCGQAAAAWAEELWRGARNAGAENGPMFFRLAESSPIESTIREGRAWVDEASDRNAAAARIEVVTRAAPSAEWLGLLEAWWSAAQPGVDVVNSTWSRIAFDARPPWSLIVTWLERGRPWSLLGIAALCGYGEAPSALTSKPDRGEFEQVLRRAIRDETGPAPKRNLQWVLEQVADLCR